MNIFVSSPDPKACALALDNSRLVKMVLETAQLLSQAVILNGGPPDGIYKTTHQHHPCSVWTRKDRNNFSWLVEHGIYLAFEYEHRFGRIHKSLEVILLCLDQASVIPRTDKAFVFDFDSSGHVGSDVHENYRNCLLQKWVMSLRRPRWTRRGPPSFAKKVIDSTTY